MNISFVPDACKGDKAIFEGSLIIRLPSAEERCEYIGESEVNLDKIREMKNDMKAVAILMRKSYDHIVKIDLKRKSDGHKISALDEFRYDPDCYGIITELAMKLLFGFVLGKT